MPPSKHFSPKEPKHQTTTLALGDGFKHANQQRASTVYTPTQQETKEGYGAHLARLAVIQNDSDLNNLLESTGHVGVFNYFKANASTLTNKTSTEHHVRLGMLLVCETRTETCRINSESLHPDFKGMLPATDPEDETERAQLIDDIYSRFGDSTPVTLVYGRALLVLMTIKSQTHDEANRIIAHFRAQAKQVSTGLDLTRVASNSKTKDAVEISIESTGVKPPNEYKDLRDFKHLVDDFLRLFDTNNAGQSIIPLQFYTSNLGLFFPNHLSELRKTFHATCNKAQEIQKKLKEKKEQIKAMMDFYFQLRDNNLNNIKYEDEKFALLSKYETTLIELRAEIKNAMHAIANTTRISMLPFDDYHALINTARETLSSLLSLDALPSAAESTLIHELRFSVKPWEKLTPLIGRRRRLHSHFSLSIPEGTENIRVVLVSSDRQTFAALQTNRLYLKRKNRYRHEILAGPFFNDGKIETDIPLKNFLRENPDTPFEGLYFASDEEDNPTTLFEVQLRLYASKPSLISHLPSTRNPRDDIYSERFTRDIFGTTGNEMPVMARGRRDSDLSRHEAPELQPPEITHVQSAPASLTIPDKNSHVALRPPAKHTQRPITSFFRHSRADQDDSRPPSRSSQESAETTSATETASLSTALPPPSI